MDAMSALILFVAAGMTAWFLTAVARAVAPRLGIVDRPGGRKKHLRTTPLLGGVAVYLAFLAIILSTELITRTRPAGFTFWLAACGGLFCLIGLVDDKWNLRARDKFGLQVIAAIPFALWAQSIQSIHLLGIDFELGWLGVAITVFWLVACTNIVNLLDGIDGLASSVGVIISLAVCALSLIYGKYEVAAASIVLSGALVGFLGHNLPPAKIFLGDAGSLTIGFLTGALAIEGSTKTATGFMLTAPLIVMSIPAFDAFLAIVRRNLNGRGIGAADRGHIHHRFLDRGFSGPQTLIAIVSLCLLMATAAIATTYFQSDILGLAICGLIIAGLMAARIWGGHESELFFRHLRLAGGVMADATGLFRSRMVITRLEMGDANQRESFWDTFCKTAQAAGTSELCFRLDRGDENGWQRNWRADSGAGDSSAAEAPDRRRSDQSASTDQAARWQIEFSADRSSGRATIELQGTNVQGQHAKGMDELLGLASVLCQTWPMNASPELAAEQDSTQVLGFPAQTDDADADQDSESHRRAA